MAASVASAHLVLSSHPAELTQPSCPDGSALGQALSAQGAGPAGGREIHLKPEALPQHLV